MWEGEDHLCDFDFADDITLIANSWSSMQQTTTALTMEAGKVGLCTNPEKCKVLTTTVWNDRTDIQAVGSDIEKVVYCNLGSYISHNGSCEKDIRVHIGKATVAFGTRKPCYRKENRAMRPMYGCPEKFWESLAPPTATFPEIVTGLLL